MESPTIESLVEEFRAACVSRFRDGLQVCDFQSCAIILRAVDALDDCDLEEADKIFDCWQAESEVDQLQEVETGNL